MDSRSDLTLVAGPIGNLGDLTIRAKETLVSCPLWVVEDSRVSSRLASHLEVRPSLTLLTDHSHPSQITKLVERIGREGPAALLTDAGTPGISDPGALLVQEAIESGLKVDALPGPSAVTLALSLSGFFAQRFAFLGFLPRKPGPAKEVLSPFVDSSLTLVLFEGPHRVLKTLETAHQALGPRRCVICRELTKLHQQVWRGTLDKLPTDKQVPAKGEFTLVIEGLRKGDLSSFESSEEVE
jgi:16S rRNA (cytidine1402-2'-O)-methyltransferase